MTSVPITVPVTVVSFAGLYGGWPLAGAARRSCAWTSAVRTTRTARTESARLTVIKKPPVRGILSDFHDEARQGPVRSLSAGGQLMRAIGAQTLAPERRNHLRGEPLHLFELRAALQQQ